MANEFEKMKCVVHRGTDYNKAIRTFQDKRVALVINWLEAYEGWQLKIIKQGLKLQES